MKRDMDIVRQILLALETGDTSETKKLDRDVLCYHNYLLVDAGLALGTDASSDGNMLPQYFVHSLTWHGHEFLDTAREPKRWEQAKSLIVDKIGGASISIWTKVLTDQMMNTITTALP